MQQQNHSSKREKSLARLAAEEAFYQLTRAEVVPPLAATTVVTVVNRRFVPIPAESPTAAVTPVAEWHATEEALTETSKKPRVFLIRPPFAESTPPSAAAEVLPSPQLMVAPVSFARRARRQRNQAAPVRVIYTAEPQAHRVQDEPAAPQGQSMESLVKALAELEPTIALIRAAMAFQVNDPEIANEWDSLSNALSSIGQ